MPFPVDQSYVKATEAKLGVVFPRGFVSRMLRDNGGEVSVDGEGWWLYPFLDTSDKTRLKRTCNDIVRETVSAREWHGFPENGIAIASNGSGDQLVLLPSATQPTHLQDAIFVWDHETGGVTKVADDVVELSSGDRT
jgi:SMI1/KNR4 family protein SUKH-1